MPITREQAEFLKVQVDGDANLSGYNLKLKKIPNYDAWVTKYTKEFPPPESPKWGSSEDVWKEHHKRWDVWEAAQDSAWIEVVNQSLLPENVVGACVIGGFTIAALKAGWEITLNDLVPHDYKSMKYQDDFEAGLGYGIYCLPTKTKDFLMEFTKLTFQELEELQQTNDAFDPSNPSWSNPETHERERNPYYAKKDYVVTRARRKALKKKIDSFVV